MTEETEYFSAKEVLWLSEEAARRLADPALINRLLVQFLLKAESNEELGVELQYILKSIELYLDGTASSLDAAFGLKRGKGRPPHQFGDRDAKIAHHILEERIVGVTRSAALADGADRFNLSTERIEQIVAGCVMPAVIRARSQRGSEGFSVPEKKILADLYADADGIISGSLPK